MIHRRAVTTTLGAALIGLSGLAQAQQAQEIYIPLVSKGFQHQFWQAVKSGAEQAAKDLKVKVTFEGPETEAMVDKQIDMLSAVVAFDSGVDSDIPVTTTTTDNKAAAALAADKMAELIGKSGEVALVVHDQTSRTGVDRRDGFVNRIKSTYPNIKIVSVQYGGGDQLKSTEITKSILQASPNLKGIFGANEGSAIGVVNGVKEMKRNGKVVIIGYDSGKQQKNAIIDGSMAGAITQNPVGMGYKTVEMAVKAIKGEKLPKVVDTGFFWYDKTNITDPKIAAVLYD
jgi:ribose transport system substrate-binding protein